MPFGNVLLVTPIFEILVAGASVAEVNFWMAFHVQNDAGIGVHCRFAAPTARQARFGDHFPVGAHEAPLAVL